MFDKREASASFLLSSGVFFDRMMSKELVDFFFSKIQKNICKHHKKYCSVLVW